ncbi:SPOR domain-containing protein [Qipengyuania sp. 6B39]|nr:SPOR domain-containing protein [Qipengyuania proteolytica]MBX7496832.1 SPOR domain-containing protein [Qipengyuania proteolytica]
MVAGWLCMLGASAPAQADVKAGVDAWGEGDYAAAVREWNGPAQAGDADAQFNLAQAYRLGRGVKTDLVRAEMLYAQAAAQGHLRAADNYGLLLFQNGQRERAMPYIEAASSRGDPRAQYLMGIAHFNGELVEKDWERAYALLTLANGTGLPQAKAALAQMDDYIPLDQRQAAQALAARLKGEAEAARARELAAADLALVSDAPPATSRTAPPPPPPAAVSRAVAQERSAAPGADYTVPRGAGPVVVARAQPQEASAPDVVVSVPASSVRTQTSLRPAASSGGPWKLQLGAFGVAGNADRLWAKLSARSELSGKEKVTIPSGRLTRLLAGGYSSEAEARAACTSLKRGGQDCLVTK